MNKQAAYGVALLGLVAIVLSALIFAFQPQFEQSKIALSNQFESNGFRFAYPDGWRYQIPQTNMLFLSSPEVLQREAGATITMQRSIRLSAEADTLDAALEIYLERGPLRSDRAWSVASESQIVTFAGRDARKTMLEGAEIEGTTLMRSEIFVTRADNSLIYIFTATAPLEQWHDLEPILTAIVESVTILE